MSISDTNLFHADPSLLPNTLGLWCPNEDFEKIKFARAFFSVWLRGGEKNERFSPPENGPDDSQAPLGYPQKQYEDGVPPLFLSRSENIRTGDSPSAYSYYTCQSARMCPNFGENFGQNVYGIYKMSRKFGRNKNILISVKNTAIFRYSYSKILCKYIFIKHFGENSYDIFIHKKSNKMLKLTPKFLMYFVSSHFHRNLH